jgi:D-aminopeptidase
MNVLISVDMEGIAGVVAEDFTFKFRTRRLRRPALKLG